MFLSTLRRRNPDFLRAVAALHQSGELPPNCYAIDLDTVAENAAAFKAEADRLGLRVFAMTKQVGRNPDMIATLIEAGIAEAVGVDLECATAAAAHGMAVGHLGHLVQVPRREAARGANLDPAFWTVFNEEKAAEAAAASAAAGRVQALLARTVSEEDRFYRGHEGGFDVDDIVAVAHRLDDLDGARFAGVTTFPTALFDAAFGRVVPTPNLGTISRAARGLARAGFEDVQVNTPGTTSAAMLQMLADAGSTQVEPGHGLTGTTPWHAVEDLVERPAIAYVSEVSHLHGGEAYVFGGGLYVDPVIGASQTQAVVVGPDGDPATATPRTVDMPAPQAIDYYATLPATSDDTTVGDTVVFGFRAQAFVTRGLTAGVSGVSRGAPRVMGVWSANGSAPIGA